MPETISEEQRAAWRSWVQEHIGGGADAVSAATDAILSSLLDGSDMDQAIAAGRAAAAASSTTAHPTSDSHFLRGIVSSMRQRSELMGNQYGSVWDFKLDRWDTEGKPQPPVAIEIRGVKIVGSIADGDWLEVAGNYRPNEVLHPHSVRNITMNAPVQTFAAASASHPFRTAFNVLFFLLALAIIVFAAAKVGVFK